jgi:hypothetical protein
MTAFPPSTDRRERKGGHINHSFFPIVGDGSHGRFWDYFPHYWQQEPPPTRDFQDCTLECKRRGGEQNDAPGLHFRNSPFRVAGPEIDAAARLGNEMAFQA